MNGVTPCLWFDTEGEAAANLYTSVFPNSKIVRISRYGSAGPRPEGSVMTVEFELDGQRHQGLNGGPEFQFTPALSLSIECADQAEVDHYWDALTDGGEESMCGWLKDRFGLSWQIVPERLYELVSDPDPVRAKAATESLFTMRKIVIAEMEAAANAVA